MQITFTLPDDLPWSSLQQPFQSYLDRWQQELRMSFPPPLIATIDSQDPWCNPDLDLPSVDTGIADLALNHDHYLYGISPQK